MVIALDGELDMANAGTLERALNGPETASTNAIVLDLEQLRFIDSTGLRIILAARERCQQRGQRFAVTPGSPQVQRLLSVTGVSQHLRTIASADELIA